MHPYNRGRTCATYAKGPLPNASLATISGKTANSSWTLSRGWYELENTWKSLLLTKQPIEKGQLEVKICRCKESGLKCSTLSCTCVNNKFCSTDACGCSRNSWCQNPTHFRQSHANLNDSLAAGQRTASVLQLQWTHSLHLLHTMHSPPCPIQMPWRLTVVNENWTQSVVPNYSSLGFYSALQCSHCKRCTRYSNSVCLSVRPSVRPTRADIVSKRRHVARCSLHCSIAKCV